MNLVTNDRGTTSVQTYIVNGETTVKYEQLPSLLVWSPSPDAQESDQYKVLTRVKSVFDRGKVLGQIKSRNDPSTSFSPFVTQYSPSHENVNGSNNNNTSRTTSTRQWKDLCVS